MEALRKARRRIGSIKSSNQLESILHTLGTNQLNRGAGRGKIKCQPTSIARRAPGKPRGAAPLTKGRRPSENPTRPKRPRSLAKNIDANVANAKSH